MGGVSADLITPNTDITERLRQEFRVRDWWPGMDSFDSARGETVPHPLVDEVAAEIERLRAVAAAALRYMEEGGEHPDDDGLHIGSASDAAALNAALDALESGSSGDGS